MDTEVQPTPPHENGSKIEDSLSDHPDGETATNGKDESKTPPKALTTQETRSRSRTPQKKKDKKNEDNLKIILKPVDESVNGLEAKKTRSSEKKVNKEASKTVEEIDDTTSKNGISTKNDDSVNKEDKTTQESKKSPTKPQSNNVSGKPKGKATETVEPEVSAKKIKSPTSEGEGVEMEPLILSTEEPDPELQFEENSDMDSGKGSPILARCKTRRSHTRKIPTPKTPKSATDSESEINSVAPTPTPENLNENNDSLNIDDISTKVEVGSETTRLDYMANNTSVFSDDTSYLNSSRERSLSDTLRSLSPRKTIRPLNDSYRQRAFRNNLNKTDLNLPYPYEDSVDRITGLKRKRSTTPEERKKFRSDGTGFVSYLSSPLSNLKNRFISDISSSSPKLTGYKDGSKDIHGEVTYSQVINEEQDKKNWCSVM